MKSELIRCRLCNKPEYEASTLTTHIVRTHKITTNEYLKRFPDAKLISDSYREKMRGLARDRFNRDPSLYQKVASRTFDFVKNKKLESLLQRDYQSARICLTNKLWKSCIILYGSIIEAILTEWHPQSRDFNEAINAAYEQSKISTTEFHKIQILRDLRNFVHLHKELTEEGNINEHWAKTFADICESVIKRFRVELEP